MTLALRASLRPRPTGTARRPKLPIQRAAALWHDVRVALVIGVGMVVVYIPRAQAAAQPADWRDLLPLIAAVFVGWSGAGLGIALLYRVAERLFASRPVRFGVVVCAAALARGVWPMSEQSLEHVSVQIGLSASTDALRLELVWMTVICALVTCGFLDRVSSCMDAVRRLALGRREEQQLRRRLVESRLQVLQARIDPQLFFDMLGVVRERYQHDPAAAERLLDHLTVFLRAALPRLRTAMSTIAQELALARAYADLLADAGHTHASLSVIADPTADDRPFPAGVLLPLVDALLRPLQRGRALPIELRTMRGDGNTRLRLQGVCAAPDSASARAHRALADVYGESAALVWRPGVGGVCVIEVEIDDAA